MNANLQRPLSWNRSIWLRTYFRRDGLSFVFCSPSFACGWMENHVMYAYLTLFSVVRESRLYSWNWSPFVITEPSAEREKTHESWSGGFQRSLVVLRVHFDLINITWLLKVKWFPFLYCRISSTWIKIFLLLICNVVQVSVKVMVR